MGLLPTMAAAIRGGMPHGIGGQHVVVVCVSGLRCDVARLGDRRKGAAKRGGQKQKDDGKPAQHAGKIGYCISNKKGRHGEIAKS